MKKEYDFSKMKELKNPYTGKKQAVGINLSPFASCKIATIFAFCTCCVFVRLGPVLVTIGDHRALECHILCIWKYPEQRVPSTTLSSYNKGCPNPAISLLMV